MCGADSALPNRHRQSAVPKEWLWSAGCPEEAAAHKRAHGSSCHSVSWCVPGHFTLSCLELASSSWLAAPVTSAGTVGHCAGVGTTIFVSMALGAVYLGVFQATTRGLSKVEALRSPPAPATGTATAPPTSTHTGKGRAAGCTKGSEPHDSSSSGPQAALLAALLTSVVMAMLTGVQSCA